MNSSKHSRLLLTIIVLLVLPAIIFASEIAQFWPETQKSQDSREIETTEGEFVTLSGTFNDVTGAPVRVSGGFESDGFSGIPTVEDIDNFIDNHAVIFKTYSAELINKEIKSVKNKTYFNAMQFIDGRTVMNTEVLLRIGESGKIVLWGADVVENSGLIWEASISLAEAARILGDYLKLSEISVITSEEVWVRSEKDVFAAYQVRLLGKEGFERPFGLVRADNGEIVGLVNEVFHATISGTVQGWVYERNALDDPVEMPLRHQVVRVSEDLTTNTDINGFYSLEDLDEGENNVEMLLESPYFTVLESTWEMVQDPRTLYDPYDITHIVEAPGEFDYTWDIEAGDITDAAANVYYQLNFVHDWWADFDPDLQILEEQFYVFPDQTGQMATNAGYQPGYPEMGYPHMILFGVGGDTLSNFGMFAEIIYHEFSHAVTNELINSMQREPMIMAIHEACSDYFAGTVLDDPDMGTGFFVNDRERVLRSLDNENVYPDDYTGEESHHDGLILGGALWDMRESLGAELADSLAHFARYGSPSDFEEYLEEILFLDDDNDDLSDGTPNSEEILAAFQAHGIGVEEEGVRDNNSVKLLPGSPSLSMPYPNPFNPSTKVDIYLPYSSHVELIVYNIAGREITRKINGNLVAGSHEISLDLADHASGMYYLTLQAGNERMTRKVVLVK
ncbi:T9SS type A sorting domain-containing protein [Calditrichota bacterium]